MEENLKIYTPANLGWLEKKLSEEEVNHLWDCVNTRQENSAKHALAGVIDNSNYFEDKNNWFWENTIHHLCRDYHKYFYNLGRNVPVKGSHPYYLEKMWVNYQKQNEFNPSHDHTGIYSFVVWLKIPYHHEQQNKNPISKNANSDNIGTFSFEFTNILGEIQTHDYHLNPENEGTLLFFPSKLRHQVYPFYNCDEDRISISGNVLVDTISRF
jgi:hypothetical protein|tara:strand:+ start:3412 stop:4047 length:636 start_codon:yes stop_codon:yes gene_type:complete